MIKALHPRALPQMSTFTRRFGDLLPPPSAGHCSLAPRGTAVNYSQGNKAWTPSTTSQPHFSIVPPSLWQARLRIKMRCRLH